MQIERTYWGYRGSRAYEPFFSCGNRHLPFMRPKDDPEAGSPPEFGYTRILFWRVKFPITHTVALDLLYWGVIAYSIAWFFFNKKI